MDPLTAIAAFNAAYATVKTASQNAGEIGKVFAGIGKLMTAKQAVQEAVRSDPQKSDLELYAAHVELETKWQEIKEILKWTGHWDKYLQFCKERREQEKQARIQKIREEAKRRKQMRDGILMVILAISILSAVGFIGFILYYINKQA